MLKHELEELNQIITSVSGQITNLDNWHNFLISQRNISANDLIKERVFKALIGANRAEKLNWINHEQQLISFKNRAEEKRFLMRSKQVKKLVNS